MVALVFLPLIGVLVAGVVARVGILGHLDAIVCPEAMGDPNGLCRPPVAPLLLSNDLRIASL